MFTETPHSLNGRLPRFILFSAPGATGKTALAQHICYSKHGIYWDLPDSKVAEFSLQGAIQNAIGAEHLSDIVNIGLHFILKNVRPYAASCSEA